MIKIKKKNAINILSLVILSFYVILAAGSIDNDPPPPPQPCFEDRIYDHCIEKGDDFFELKNYEQSLSYYEEALNIEQNNQKNIYVKSQIAQIYIYKADTFLNDEKYDQAMLDYQKALGIYKEIDKNNKNNPNFIYIQNQMDKIAEIAHDFYEKGNDFFANNNYESAEYYYNEALKIFQSYDPKSYKVQIENQLNEIENKRKQYNEFKNNADTYYENKDYDQADIFYNKALNYASTNPTQQDKINYINNQIDKIDSYKEKYQELVKNGNIEFLDKNYDKAEKDYQQALEIYPKHLKNKEIEEKLNNIETIRQNYQKLYDQIMTIFDDKNNYEKYGYEKEEYYYLEYDKINEIYKEGLNLYPKNSKNNNIAEKINEEYQYLLEKAKKAEQVGSPQSGKFYYERALKLDPDNSNNDDIKLKINKIDNFIDNFQKLINDADNKFKEKDYDMALEKYNTALKQYKYHPKTNDIKAQISEIQKIKEKCQSLINEGKVEYDKMFYNNAKNYYEEALELCPKDDQNEALRNNIFEVEQKITEQWETLLLQWFNEGNKLFENKKYEEAEKCYNDILKFIPELSNSSQYKQQIGIINQQLEIIKSKNNFKKFILSLAMCVLAIVISVVTFIVLNNHF